MAGKKSALRKDRVHGNATVGKTERKLEQIANLPPGYAVKIVGPSGRDVRDDAKLKNL